MYIRDLFVTFACTVVGDVVIENAKEDLMKEVLYADDLVLIRDTMEGLKERFLKWRSALKSKELKGKLKKMKVMVCGSEGEVI